MQTNNNFQISVNKLWLNTPQFSTFLSISFSFNIMIIFRKFYRQSNLTSEQLSQIPLYYDFYILGPLTAIPTFPNQRQHFIAF